jgi:hypothetical protein
VLIKIGKEMLGARQLRSRRCTGASTAINPCRECSVGGSKKQIVLGGEVRIDRRCPSTSAVSDGDDTAESWRTTGNQAVVGHVQLIVPAAVEPAARGARAPEAVLENVALPPVSLILIGTFLPPPAMFCDVPVALNVIVAVYEPVPLYPVKVAAPLNV